MSEVAQFITDYFSDPTPVQKWARAVPEDINVFMHGTRSSGKTRSLMELGARHIAKWGPDAHVLFLKSGWKGLRQIIDDTEAMLKATFRDPVTDECLVELNRSEGLFHFKRVHYDEDGVTTYTPGGTWRFEHVNSTGEYAKKLQGVNATQLLADECTSWPDDKLLNMATSNLRSNNPAVPIRFVWCSNPSGKGHQTFAERFAFKSKSDTIPTSIKDGANECILIPSNFRDNQHINAEEYLARLKNSAPNEAVFEAWSSGSWHISEGSYWSGTLIPHYNMIDDWPVCDLAEYPFLTPIVSYDHGCKKPAVWMVGVEFKESAEMFGRAYFKNDIVIVDEGSTARDNDPTDGGGEQITSIALDILRTCMHWGIPPKVYADDAVIADMGQGSVKDFFSRLGVTMVGAGKGSRIPGWQAMTSMFKAAHVDSPNIPEDPRLLVTQGCKLFWRTTPNLQVSERYPEDLAKVDYDNSADCLRYLVTAKRTGRVGTQPGIGNPDFKRYQYASALKRAKTQEEIKRRALARGEHTIDFAAMRGGRVFSQEFTRR